MTADGVGGGAAGSPEGGRRNERSDVQPAGDSPAITVPSPDHADRDARAASERAEPRPWLERIGLAAIAFVMGALLSVMAAASWTGGELILAAMSASGALLTVGVGLMTLVRG